MEQMNGVISNYFKIIFIILLVVIHKIKADILCDNDKRCPIQFPCCSQFNVCGRGSSCLGGCNPFGSYKEEACMSMPVMDSFYTRFDSLDILQHERDFIGNTQYIDWLYTGNVAIHEGNLLLQLAKGSTATVISSTTYLLYGKVSVTMKTSRGNGIITAFILYSNLKDEIDYEFVGSSVDQVQTNYYYRGILNHTHFTISKLLDTFSNFHTYTIDWTEDKLTWFVDGKLLRVLKKNDTWDEDQQKYLFPLSPSRIQISLWPGGLESATEGTREWAGGYIDWNHEDPREHGYYYAVLNKINVHSYSYEKKLRFSGLLSNNPISYDFLIDDSSDLRFFILNQNNVLINSASSGLDKIHEQVDREFDSVFMTYNSSGRNVKVKKKEENNILYNKFFQTSQDADLHSELTSDPPVNYKRVKKKTPYSSNAYSVFNSLDICRILKLITLYLICLFVFT